MTNTIFIPCGHCGTEGRIYRSRSGHPNDPDDIDCGPCPVCGGACEEEVEAEPVALADLELIEEEIMTGDPDLSIGSPNDTAHRDEIDDGYAKYRGKCKEMSEALVAADPALTLVRGHYHCPFWGEQPHWWTKRATGEIVDPTKDQFPSRGIGEYVEFDGTVECSNCGKMMREDEAEFESNYVFCSYECHGKFVGVF